MVSIMTYWLSTSVPSQSKRIRLTMDAAFKAARNPAERAPGNCASGSKPIQAKPARMVSDSGAVERQAPAIGMRQIELSRMQHQGAGRRAGRPRFRRRHISDRRGSGNPSARTVNAELMGPAGERLQRKPGRHLAGARNRPIARHRFCAPSTPVCTNSKSRPPPLGALVRGLSMMPCSSGGRPATSAQ